MINLKTDKWELKNIETILFDKDGTFIDLHYFWGKMTELRAEEIIKKFSKDNNLKPKLCLYLGYDISTKKMLPDGITAMYSRSQIIEIFKSNLADENIMVTTSELEKIFDEVSEKFYKNILDYTKPIDDAIKFIKEVHSQGIKLGIVTSDSEVSTKLTLKQFNWEHLFDVAIGREASPETKESGALTKIALKKLNANPETTIMIGDAPMDFLSAKNAGVKNTILVATGQINENTLKKTSPYTTKNLKSLIITKS